MKKLTVLVPCYNFFKYLPDCIRSIYNQKTNFDFDVIIRDDGSTDNTKYVLENLKIKFPNLIILDGTKNLGAFGNIKLLHESSNSEYIAYLDGDDMFGDEDKLQKQVDFLDNNPDYVMTFSGYWGRQPDGGYAPDSNPGWLGLIGFENDEIITKDLLITNYVTFGKMFKNIKNIIKDWMMDLPYYDWALNYEISRHGKIKFLDYPMGVYRHHDTGVFSLLSRDEKEKMSSVVKEKILEKHLEYEKN